MTSTSGSRLERARAGRSAPARRLRIAIAAVVSLAIIGAGAAVPATPAAADPVPSSMTISTPSALQHVPYTINVSITSAIQATGEVVFTEGGVELARTNLLIGFTSLTLASPQPETRTIVATYAGNDEVAPASAETTFTVAPADVPNPMTGTIVSGPSTFTVGEGNSFATAPLEEAYDPVSGLVSSNSRFTVLSTSAVLPTYGPVTVTVRPFWTRDPRVFSDGTVAGTRASRLQLSVLTITRDGVTRNAECSLNTSGELTGTRDDDGLTLQLQGTIAPVRNQDCLFRGAVVNAMLAGPLSLQVEVPGSFPLPAPLNTPSETTLDIEGPLLAEAELVQATATVTVPGFPAVGFVEFFVNGTRRAQRVLVDGVATAPLNLDTSGPTEITANFLGYQGALSPSSDTAILDVAPPPDGLPATGVLAIGTNGPSPVPDGSRLVGASLNQSTGAIGPSTFWLPQGQTNLTVAGSAQVQYRLVQTTPASGQIAPDGTTTFDPATFVIEVRSYGGALPTVLEDCTIGPITATFTGTADDQGLEVSATGAEIPLLDPNECNGLAPFINPSFEGGANLSFTVAGDFSVDPSTTAMTLSSWFPNVNQHDQTFVVAQLTGPDPTPPTGTVTFRDGTTVVGTGTIGPAGFASTLVTMDEPGTRTITATYTGDDDNGPASATTTIEVTPTPDGRAVAGTVAIGDATIDIGPGSTLVDGPEPDTASITFVPDTIEVDLAGYGTVQVDVRLTASNLSTSRNAGPGLTSLDGYLGLHIRRITTDNGTIVPRACVNIIGFELDGTPGATDTTYTSTIGGAARWDLPGCTGIGRATAEHLTTNPVTANLTVTT